MGVGLRVGLRRRDGGGVMIIKRERRMIMRSEVTTGVGLDDHGERSNHGEGLDDHGE